MKGGYGWRRFVLYGRRGFTDYSIVVTSGGWRSGFRASGRGKGLTMVEQSTLTTTSSITVIDTLFLTVKKQH
ncbi:hypothetical protein Hanom_Chr06g00570191 [Helianthus anomalus]